MHAFGPATGLWRSTHPRESSSLLGDLQVQWWVAGGWALDLYLRCQSRPHKDLDIGIPRRDVVKVIGAMGGWEFFGAKGGQLWGPVTDAPEADINALWGRPARSDCWVLEFMLDEVAGDHWTFRRDHSIGRPLYLAIRTDADGLRYIAPEIQLLYKANLRRPEDQADFDLVRPVLTEEASDWLRSALRTLYPDHPWVAALSLRS